MRRVVCSRPGLPGLPGYCCSQCGPSVLPLLAEGPRGEHASNTPNIARQHCSAARYASALVSVGRWAWRDGRWLLPSRLDTSTPTTPCRRTPAWARPLRLSSTVLRTRGMSAAYVMHNMKHVCLPHVDYDSGCSIAHLRITYVRPTVGCHGHTPAYKPWHHASCTSCCLWSL